MGIQSEELAADTDARIVRIGNRLARPLFSNVDPVRRRGVRALLDECARLERIFERVFLRVFSRGRIDPVIVQIITTR